MAQFTTAGRELLAWGIDSDSESSRRSRSNRFHLIKLTKDKAADICNQTDLFLLFFTELGNKCASLWQHTFLNNCPNSSIETLDSVCNRKILFERVFNVKQKLNKKSYATCSHSSQSQLEEFL